MRKQNRQGRWKERKIEKWESLVEAYQKSTAGHKVVTFSKVLLIMGELLLDILLRQFILFIYTELAKFVQWVITAISSSF